MIKIALVLIAICSMAMGSVISVQGDANAWADNAPLKVLALGDSTTAGTPYYESPVERPPDGAGDEKAPYTYWLGAGHPEWTVYNQGVTGERTDEIFQRFQDSKVTADVIIVLAGVNDMYQGYSSDRVKSNLEKIYQLALQRKMKVVACTILPYDESTSKVKRDMEEVNKWIRQVAAENGFLFCDTYSVARDPADPGHLAGSPDGFHPDKATYEKIGLELAGLLNRTPSG